MLIGLALSVCSGGQAPDLVVNGGFTTDLSGWTATVSGTAAVAWNAGVANISGDGVNSGFLSQAIPTVPGRQHTITFDVTTGNAVLLSFGTTLNGSDVLAAGAQTTGVRKTVSFTPTTTSTFITFSRSGSGITGVDNVSVRAP